jgi:hypothetical protein
MYNCILDFFVLFHIRLIKINVFCDETPFRCNLLLLSSLKLETMINIYPIKSVTHQKTVIFIVTALRTSYLTSINYISLHKTWLLLPSNRISSNPSNESR